MSAFVERMLSSRGFPGAGGSDRSVFQKRCPGTTLRAASTDNRPVWVVDRIQHQRMDMNFLGFLFGFGFDTASEVALPGIAGARCDAGPTDLIDSRISRSLHGRHDGNQRDR